VAQLVKQLLWAQVMIPGSGGGLISPEPHGPHVELPAQQGVCFTLLLCPYPVLVCKLSLSQINKNLLKSTK